MKLFEYIEEKYEISNWDINSVSKWFNDALKDHWEIKQGSYEEGQIHIQKDNIKAVIYIPSSTGYYNKCGVYILNEFDFATLLNYKNYNFKYIQRVIEINKNENI